MISESVRIEKFQDSRRPQVLKVWEESVLATHHFLSEVDFIEIKDLVQSIDFNLLKVFCLLQDENVLGFIGVVDRKIEMLFIAPEYFGKGHGKMLLQYAVDKLKADEVDVNEQNLNALKFYQKSGFNVFERTDKDDQGRPYPLLRLRLGGGC